MRHMARIKKKPKLNTFMLHSKSTYFYRQRRFSYSIPLASTLALLLVMGLCINPVGGLSGNSNSSDSEKVYAADNIPGEPGYDDIVPENGVALRIDTALNDKDTVEEQVTGTGTQYIKVDFTVGANNIQNYDVYVQADSTALTGQAHGDKLQSITSNTAGTVGTKEWGYGVSRGDVDPSTMTYRPIQTSVSTSADGQDAGEGNTLTGISQPYTLAFAANLEGAVSDHYKSNITLSVAAGAEDISGLYSIEYMQDITSSICTDAKENDTVRLIDRRDSNKYWVTKLKDGNCWMTQNLAYGDPNSIIIAIKDWSIDSPLRQYNNPGLYIYDAPTTPNLCANTSVGLSACTSSGWRDVSNWTVSDDPNFVDAVDAANKVYNAHYLTGNYYSFNAATAGSGANISSGNALGSICPAGWQLPAASGDKSYETLLASYGTKDASDNKLQYGDQDIRTDPLYFTYSGIITKFSNPNTPILYAAGGLGEYWTSSVIYTSSTSTSDAARLYFSTSVDTSSHSVSSDQRFIGLSIRCVAR